MNVNINETWNDKTMIDFNGGIAGSGKVGRNGNNTTVGNGDVRMFKCSVSKNRPTGQQQLHSDASLSALSAALLSKLIEFLQTYILTKSGRVVNEFLRERTGQKKETKTQGKGKREEVFKIPKI
jgi:hypothetical protein